MRPGIVQFHLVFLLFDRAEHRTLPGLDLGLLQIGLRLLQVGDTFLGVAVVLRLFLLDLMPEIVELGLGLQQAV